MLLSEAGGLATSQPMAKAVSFSRPALVRSVILNVQQ